AVRVVLRRDAGKRFRFVAIALEIKLGDAAENAGKATRRIAFLAPVASVEQNVADLIAWRHGHLFGSDDENEASRPRGNRICARMNGGGTRGTGVFDPRCRAEPQFRIGIEGESGGE